MCFPLLFNPLIQNCHVLTRPSISVAHRGIKKEKTEENMKSMLFFVQDADPQDYRHRLLAIAASSDRRQDLVRIIDRVVQDERGTAGSCGACNVQGHIGESQ
jgi:hypothetical protein